MASPSRPVAPTVAKTAGRIAYSYIRFSTPDQARGDSLRRQTDMATEWCRVNNYVLSDMTFKDLGISSFRNANAEAGMLGEFVDAIAIGRIKAGSVLIIEAVDRLSRSGIYTGMGLIQQILNRDVEIVILRPSEQRLSKSSSNDLNTMMIVTVQLYLANLESKNKQDRLLAVWQEKRKQYNAGKTKQLSKRGPAWISFTEDGMKVNDKAKYVAAIFKFAKERDSIRTIAAKMNRLYPGKAFGGNSKNKTKANSKTWSTSYVSHVLSSRTVLGELQFHSTNAAGRRIPVGDAIKDYYPRIISDSDFDAANGNVRSNPNNGRKSKHVNLLKSLVYSLRDGAVCHCVEHGQGGRRLWSSERLSQNPTADPYSIAYVDLEFFVLAFLAELDVSLVLPQENAVSIPDMNAEVAGIDLRITALENALVDDTVDVISVGKAISALRAKRTALLASIEEYKASTYAVGSVEEMKRLIGALGAASAEGGPRHRLYKLLGKVYADPSPELRSNEALLRLRSLIASLVESVWVWTEKHAKRCWYWVVVVLKSGVSRQFWFSHVGCSDGVFDAPLPEGWTKGDTSLVEGWQNHIANNGAAFSDIVPAYDNAPVPLPAVLGATIGSAAESYLAWRRGDMNSASFGVLRPRLRAFVAFVGADMPCTTLTAFHLSSYVLHLKTQVSNRVMSVKTANVYLGRCTEFVRFLFEKEACKPFPVGSAASYFR